VHTFRNDGDGPVRLLNFNTPAGFKSYMRDPAEAAHSGPLTPEVIARTFGEFVPQRLAERFHGPLRQDWARRLA
jgi:hypothetical protein